ncbi:UDP-glucose 4-epimerase GalE [Mesobacillus foraminis]|uniref:UDP-glucose 4-epimerase n=1 Tax=Mesobacillus foraminis TaxID=279826 RepID=A0A4R2B9A2_9BACI|nr:UDP-glucose 4-epimerase GalE [Mesobacillus foraminis]TCN22189.1 UDP-glucose 4-epimerase [Mesobacillus foraminis]
MAILITGGAGYIGSHTCVELLNGGYQIVVLDNFSNSKPEAIRRITEITGKQFMFYEIDLLDRDNLEKVFTENNIEAVIHFAGLKAVGESVEFPLKYYHNNIVSTIVLSEVMNKFDVKKLVFSSSATVYGIPDSCPISEDFPLGALNPYGRTKLMIEDIFSDLYASDSEWSITLLRYFNPVGAHKSSRIGEDPNGTPNNLMPYISQVAVGKLPYLNVFGKEYPTPDGTGVRDYIHVLDLALGHVKALGRALNAKGIEAYNLGTGKGYSVMEMIKTFERVTGIDIPYKIVNARPGDTAICFADPKKAKKELDWIAKYGVEEMCADSWNWQINNPNGYDHKELAFIEK